MHRAPGYASGFGRGAHESEDPRGEVATAAGHLLVKAEPMEQDLAAPMSWQPEAQLSFGPASGGPSARATIHRVTRPKPQVSPFALGQFAPFGDGAASGAEATQDDGPTASEQELRTAVMTHPLYPRLLEAITDCHKAGETDKAVLRNLDSTYTNALLDVERLREEVGADVESDEDLDAFMEAYVEVTERLVEQLEVLRQGVNDSHALMEASFGKMSVKSGQGAAGPGDSDTHPSTAGGSVAPGRDTQSEGGPSSVAGSRRRGDNASSAAPAAGSAGPPPAASGPEAAGEAAQQKMGNLLKRRYAETVTALQEEFATKRARTKLDPKAVDVLQGWFNAHYAWPYPSEDERNKLAAASELETSQVTTWFINKRKRMWHRQFGERQPANEAEARRRLKEMGIKLPQ